MNPGVIARGALPFVRRFSTTSVRRSGDHHDTSGILGSNLPFDVNNKFKLTSIFILYVGSGLATPFLIVRHSLTKG